MIKVNDFVIITEKIKEIEKNSVGFIKEISKNKAKVFFIGKLKEIDIELTKVKLLDIEKTGRPKGTSKEYPTKICNVCHILKPIDEFDINQNSVVGKTRRPTCKDCRKNIDGVSLKSSEKRGWKLLNQRRFFCVQYVKKHQFLV